MRKATSITVLVAGAGLLALAVLLTVANSSTNRSDLLGLGWKVTRSKSYTRAAAEVVSTSGLSGTLLPGSTVRELANSIGLSADDYQHWLEPNDGALLPVNADVKLYCRRFKIPNTVVQFWGWTDAPWFDVLADKALFKWSDSAHYLMNRGFYVIGMDADGTSLKLQNKAESLSNAKELHGIYVWAHGCGTSGDSLRSYAGGIHMIFDATTVRLKYKMGLGIFLGCRSSSGGAFSDLVSPSGIFKGWPGLTTPQDSNIPISLYFTPGAQATNP